MIVRDEAHVVTETLECVAPYLDYWVVVDTGSTDATIDVVRSYFGAQGIPGELHSQPWRDFGTNRTAALELCRGKADYVWVIDADDLVVGTLDLRRLTADSYSLRYGPDFTYWRAQIFRSALPWRYEGVLHEYAVCDEPDASEERLEGEYHVVSRRQGGRSRSASTYRRDARVLTEALKENPNDERAVFYLAQSWFDAGELRRALRHYSRRSAMGGYDEEVCYSLLRKAQCLELLGEPSERVVQAYLDCWSARPSRAEPLYELARHHRVAGRHALGYLFARQASEIPYPESDALFLASDVYRWRIADEQSICAYYLDKHRESFELCSRLLGGPWLPEHERERVLANRDFAAQRIWYEPVEYPEDVVRRLAARARRQAGRPRITLTITACRRQALFEETVNSFLSCCEDVERIGRWICVDDGSSPADRKRMRERYPFFEFVFKPKRDKGHARSMNRILELVESPYWLHLEDDWRFMVRGRYVERALAILADDARIGQALFNRNYGETLGCREIAGGSPRRTKRARIPYRLHDHVAWGTEEYERYVERLPPGAGTNAWWPHYSLRPSLSRTAVVRSVGRYDQRSQQFELDFAKRYAELGYRSAFFDEITCLHTGALTFEAGDDRRLNAYDLNEEWQFGFEPRGAPERAT